MPSSHHIVVVGGGVAGLAIASKLPRTAGRTPMAVTLIDREPAYVYKPMLHAIAAGTSDFSQQETNYIAQARDRHFVFHPGELKGIDRDAQRLRLGPLMIGGRSIVPERTISYDTLILATGSQANDFGTPGVQQYCHMVDSRSQALDLNREIRTRMLESLAASSTLSIAVVGGGATGVELTAELIELTQIAAYYGATGLPSQVKVKLVESGPQLLTAFPQRVAVAARLYAPPHHNGGLGSENASVLLAARERAQAEPIGQSSSSEEVARYSRIAMDSGWRCAGGPKSGETSWLGL